MKADYDPMRSLWVAYKTTGDRKAREKLILKNIGLVDYPLGRISSRIPPMVDVRDLRSAGIMGLIKAVEGFELGQGIKFITYASPRIKGSILDELRGLDWMSRNQRERTNRMKYSIEHFQFENGREPSREELAKLLGVKIEDLGPLECEYLVRNNPRSIDASIEQESPEGRTEHLRDLIEDKTNGTAFQEVDRRDFLKKLLGKARLKPTERELLKFYYEDSLTMKEIGVQIGLSEPRVYQIHEAVMDKLRKAALTLH
jgi:RNA polymerase sigma factor for flagellar operon FliA